MGYLRFELVQRSNNPSIKPMMSTMARTRATLAEELHPAQEDMEEVAATPEVPKSPRTMQLRKDKQTMGPIQVSPRFNKLPVEEKGQATTIEINEDEEDLQDLIAQIKAQDEEVEDAIQLPSLPPYLPPWHGMAKIPKDLDTAKRTLQTPLLPNDIRFDGFPLGQVPSIKFEDWDLVDHEKFPQLDEDKLLK